MHADNSHAAQALTDAAAPDPATLAAVGSGKINSNIAQPTGGQIASPTPTVEPSSDISLAASFGVSYDNSDYVESAENSPTRLANMIDLKVHISEIEIMHEVLEEYINAIV